VEEQGQAVRLPFPPPLAALFCGGAAWLLERAAPTSVPFVFHRLGWLLIAVAVALFVAAVLALRQAGASPDPRVPVPAIAERGVYRFSRNPIYLAMGLGLAGAGLTWDSMWIVASAAAALGLLQTMVVAREEAYLSVRFPSEYASYRARVRRWL